MENIVPVIDMSAIQEKANEYALKGAVETIKEFYSGYNSPYKKAITQELENKAMSIHISLPDIVGLINDKLSAEIDKIANTAITKTFIPIVSQMLTRREPVIEFSELLKNFIAVFEGKNVYRDDFSVTIKPNVKYGWLDINISGPDKEYDLTLHVDAKSKKECKPLYYLASLPYTRNSRERFMKLSVENATLELPFVSDVLEDNFVSFAASIIIGGTLIRMDTDDFYDDLFVE